MPPVIPAVKDVGLLKELRRKFNQNLRRPGNRRFRFNTYLRWFTRNLPYREIAKKENICIEAVRQSRANYFAPLLPNLGDGRERMRLRQLKINEERILSFPIHPITRVIIGSAKARRFKVQRIIGARNCFCALSLRINKKRCLIRRSSRIFGKYGYTYLCFDFSAKILRRWDFFLLTQVEKGVVLKIFILPRRVVLEILGIRKCGGIYIPIREVKRGYGRKAHDFTQYENAWHLLRDVAH